MALRTPTNVVPIGGWVRGLNRDVFELQLGLDEIPDLINVDIGLRGEVNARDGYARYDTVVAMSGIAQLLYPYKPATGTDKFVAVRRDGDIWDSVDGTSWIDSTETFGGEAGPREYQINPAMLNDDLFLFSLRGNTRRWDGTSWVEITNKTLDNTGTALAPQAPQAATATVHNNRIWAGSVVANGTTSRSRVMWSVTPVEVTSGEWSGVLNEALTDVETDADFDGGVGTLPSLPVVIQINAEKMLVTANSGNNTSGTFTIERGYASTTPAAHADDDTIAIVSDDTGGNRWKATSFIDVDEDDGTEVRHIVSFQSNLIIFKDYSTYVLSGVDEDSFTLYPVDDEVGCLSPQTVALSESDLFFLDPTEGVHVFDGVKMTRIDTAINNYLIGGMNQSKAHLAFGHFFEGKYYLSVPWGSDTYNSRTFVFDTRNGAWTEYDIGWFHIAEWESLSYMAGAENGAGIFTFQQGDADDNGTPFSWYFETAWFPQASQQGMTRHRLRRADLWLEADDGTMTVAAYVDGVESAVWTQAVTASTNRIRLPAYGALWETMKFKISGTSS